MPTATPDDLKRQAAAEALKLVKSGMKLGLGTGSTAAHFVKLLGEKVKGGLQVVCVPTSDETAKLAREHGVPLTTLEETPMLDLCVDGADEIDPSLNLIKGGGAALLREKIVASASEEFVVIADASKIVDDLGKFPLPVEVAQFGHGSTKLHLEDAAEGFDLEAKFVLRKGKDGKPLITDGGNFIYDGHLGRIPDPMLLETVIKQIPGVVEVGLFCGMAAKAIIATPDGVETLDAPDPDFDDLLDLDDRKH
jgi:ribose 5-phosphate isomerase A